MRLVKFLFIFYILSISGCGYSHLESFLLSQEIEEDIEDNKIDLPSLLQSGWEFYVYEENKVILIKHTNSGLLINDVFGVLND